MFKHGLYNSPEYRSWLLIRQLCNNANHPEYKSYGGRGIKVCERWNNFELFYNDMGDKPHNHYLCRKNCEGDYCKINCFWTKKKKSKPPENLKGKVFGLWVVKQLIYRNSKPHWEVECTNCGCLRIKKPIDIKRLLCCQICQNKSKGFFGLRKLLRTYKINARNRKLKWELSEDDFRILTSSNCHYCDAPPSNTSKAARGKTGAWGSYLYNGIDRYDNKLGYSIKNCRPCCEFCNSFKKDQTPHEWELRRKRFAIKYSDCRICESCDLDICDTTVCDAKVFTIKKHVDNRGYFQELYSLNNLSFNVKQINLSCSKANTLRGLHIAPFGKLVHCVKGAIFDVVADVRVDSKTFGKWFGIKLSQENHKSLYIPPNCAHGFLSFCEDSIIIYAQDGLYDSKTERSIRYNDPTINISWPICEGLNISEKDMVAPFLNTLYAKD